MKPKTPPLDPKTANEIIALTQTNIPIHTICTALGIKEEHLASWLDAGAQAQKGALRDFHDAYKKAHALGEIELLTVLRQHAKTNPTAAFQLLEYQRRTGVNPAANLPPSEPLKNSRHEAFAIAKASGKSDTDAYQAAFKCSRRTADGNASRLMGIHGIQQRVAALMARTATRFTLTHAERREIASQIARDPNVEPHVRLNATVIESKHAGEFLERQDLTSDGEALPTVLPQITLNVPESFTRRRTGAN